MEMAAWILLCWNASESYT